jgi:hypothetical protein
MGHAQSCQSTLQDHISWAQTKALGPGKYSLRFSSANSLLGNVIYREGSLAFKPAVVFGGQATLAGFSGTVDIYFSNKRYGSTPSYPFNPSAKQTVSVSFGSLLAKISIGTSSIEPRCDFSGVLYGTLKPNSGSFSFSTFEVISLTRVFSPEFADPPIETQPGPIPG